MCWGRGSYGELGNADTLNASVPVNVANLADAVAIAGGGAVANVNSTHLRAALGRGPALVGRQHLRTARQRDEHQLVDARGRWRHCGRDASDRRQRA